MVPHSGLNHLVHCALSPFPALPHALKIISRITDDWRERRKCPHQTRLTGGQGGIYSVGEGAFLTDILDSL